MPNDKSAEAQAAIERIEAFVRAEQRFVETYAISEEDRVVGWAQMSGGQPDLPLLLGDLQQLLAELRQQRGFEGAEQD